MRLIVSALGYCRSPASFDFTLTDTSSDAGVNRVEFLSIGTLCFKVEKLNKGKRLHRLQIVNVVIALFIAE